MASLFDPPALPGLWGDAEDYDTRMIVDRMRRNQAYENSLFGRIADWLGRQQEWLEGASAFNPIAMALEGAQIANRWAGSPAFPERVQQGDMLAPLGLGAMAAPFAVRGAIGSAGGKLKGARPEPGASIPKAGAMGAPVSGSGILAETAGSNVQGTIAPRQPQFRRYYSVEVSDRHFQPAKVQYAPLGERPKGVPRRIWDEQRAKPWIVGDLLPPHQYQPRFATEQEARAFAERGRPDQYQTFVHEAHKAGLSAFETMKRWLDDRGVEYTADTASTGSQYITVRNGDQRLKVRFSDHSRHAAIGGKSRSHTRWEWDLSGSRSQLASALRSIDEWLSNER